MILGILSDIHGNLEALQNCFRFFEKQKVDKVYFLGDAIGYLPKGLEVINFLQSNKVDCLKGNHEAMLLGLLKSSLKNGEVYKLNLIYKNITKSQIEFIQSWKNKIDLRVKDKVYLLVHGSPGDFLSGYVYPDSDLGSYKNLTYDGCIMGHTHRPFIRKEHCKTFINVGSVGLPRDIGYLSSCCIFNSYNEEIIIYRVPFNVNSVLKESAGMIHPDTMQCLKRINDTFVGTLTN